MNVKFGSPSDSPAMATGEATVEFLSACCRLMDLLSKASVTGDGGHTGDRQFCASMFDRLPKGLESKSASGGIRFGIPIRHCLGA
jgi:hypothetical protein